MGELITLENFRRIMPHGARAGRLEARVEVYRKACPAYEIDTPERLAPFIATLALESGEFRYARELGDDDYFARYNGRKDLGNVQPGDGQRFPGRGDIQTTGRLNYGLYTQYVQRQGHQVDFVANPELLEQLPWAADTACWFWRHGPNGNLNQLADLGMDEAIRRRVNGGLNGYTEFLGYLEIARAVFGAKSLKPVLLRLGMFDDPRVERLQRALIARGARIDADGDFGPGTYAAVVAHQAANDLTADGIAGPLTLQSLDVAA